MERKSIRKRLEVNNDMENGDLLIENPSSLKGDRRNIALLICLYTLQGIPLGLSASIPMMLQNRGVSYKQQAEFSFVMWPFSLKLLWAPIVDSIYSARIGRRKTWLIPTQYLIGGFMLFFSSNIDRFLGNSEGQPPNIEVLTLLFFSLNFLAATQDIAVDGWALTMLKKQNVGHASTCNSLGQTAGYILSYVVFMALESPDFCNTYLRSEAKDTGIVTLSGFFYFWGLVFLVTTTLVALLKHETEGRIRHEPIDRDIHRAYKSLKNILSLRPVQILVVILLTCKIGFSATDSVMSLKLVESGVPKERLGLMAIPVIPLQMIIPIYLARYTNGPRPLDVFLKAAPYRLIFGLIAALIVWITPKLIPDPTQGLPFLYVVILIMCFALHQVCVYSMFVALMAFFAKISDTAVGGTYMTLLNTLTNFGGTWPGLLALYFVDPLTYKQCEGGTESLDNLCRNTLEKDLCNSGGGHCVTIMDGFYIETLICCIIGFLWLMWGKNKVNHIQNLDENAWKLNKSHR